MNKKTKPSKLKDKKIAMIVGARHSGKHYAEQKEKQKLQEKIQAYTIKVLQVLNGLPLLHGLMILDTAKSIVSQEFDKKSKEDKSK